MAWMITGAGRNKPTKWGGGAGACKTSFKTNIIFKDKDSKKIPHSIEEGEFMFNGVKPGDKLYYNVETGADSKKAKSDEYYFVISTLNWTYLIPIVNQVNSSATPEQLEEWKSDESAYINHLATIIDPSRMFLTYFSKIEDTSESGISNGSLKIPADWPTGPMQIALMYGYNADARTGDSSRAWTNVFDTLTWIALAVSVIALFVACPATLGVACGIGAGIVLAIDVAEMTKLAYDQYSQGIMADIGRNKYDCSFPDGGYVHIYNMMMFNENNDPFNRINKEAFENVESIQQPAPLGASMVNKNTIMLMVASAGFIFAISSIMGDD